MVTNVPLEVPMFGVLTDAHKQLLAGALELVRCAGLVAVLLWF